MFEEKHFKKKVLQPEPEYSKYFSNFESDSFQLP